MAGGSALASDLHHCMDETGTVHHPFRNEHFRSKKDALALLEAMHSRIDIGVPKEQDAKGKALLRIDGVQCLQEALEWECFTVSDLQKMLLPCIQFYKVYQRYFGESHQEPREHELSYENAQYIEILLFLVELLDPSTDRLRRPRCKYEICAVQHAESRTPSPEQRVAAWAWEKRLRSDSQFQKAQDILIRHMEDVYHLRYWMFSVASRCSHFTEGMFIAFNDEMNIDLAASSRVVANLYRVDSDDGPVFGVNVLLRACTQFSIEMIGTPFLTPPLSSELHFMAQQITLAAQGNAIRITIPSFYRGNHLASLLEQDFYDLRRAVEGELVIKPFATVRSPDPGSSPLSDREMAEAGKVIRKVLEGQCGLSKYLSFLYMVNALSYWWVHGSADPEEGTTEVKSRITRFIRQPHAPARGNDLFAAIPSRSDIIRMVSGCIGKCNLCSEEKFAWAKFGRAISKL